MAVFMADTGAAFNSRVMYSERCIGGAWSAPVPLLTPTIDPQLRHQSTEYGRPHLVVSSPTSGTGLVHVVFVQWNERKAWAATESRLYWLSKPLTPC
jgi:hypothetical protein